MNDFRDTKQYKDIYAEGEKWINERKYKMTRIEAINKLNLVDTTDRPISANERNYVLLKKLEALGLIKFDQDQKENEPDNLDRVLKECRAAYVTSDEFIKALERRGYKIVMKDD